MLLVPISAVIAFEMSWYCFDVTVQMSPNKMCVAIALYIRIVYRSDPKNTILR